MTIFLTLCFWWQDAQSRIWAVSLWRFSTISLFDISVKSCALMDQIALCWLLWTGTVSRILVPLFLWNITNMQVYSNIQYPQCNSIYTILILRSDQLSLRHIGWKTEKYQNQDSQGLQQQVPPMLFVLLTLKPLICYLLIPVYDTL